MISTDFLCDNAHFLLSLRSLTFGLEPSASHNMLDPRFYSRLNDAFPRLTCLMIRDDMWPVPSVP
jgi:hypothetical protein